MERKALGKGLGALIPEAPQGEKGERILFAPIDEVRPNPLQPRENFDPLAMEELIQSVREKGVIQPVLVRRQGAHFEIIAGERRYRAAKSLNLKEIPVIVKNVEDRDSLELSLIENIQRQELNAIEEARAYQYLISKFNVTQEELSDILGKARATVANILRLLNLPKEVQDEIKNGRLSFAHGRGLLEIEDANLQRRIAQEIISKSLSVRELESILKNRRLRGPKRKAQQANREAYVLALEEALQHALATKVRINKQKKRGSILIEFYSQQDLERIAEKIRGGNRA
ncbi:MAG: ParB/RepB/Spo0J family partition protein [Candidatus Omnitrophica bacterium]|nr:ParB/RepB/Spo0J family partition protein [Candidatus Omnitrophota bacterium]